MDICHLYSSREEAKEKYEAFVKYPLLEEIPCLNGKGKVLKPIYDHDGINHHFMSKDDYKQWCKGRTYMLDNGTPMHSGHRIK